MRRAAMVVAFAVLVGVATAGAGSPPAPVHPAAAATENRVVEIVQTGPEPDAPVKTACVRFSESTITGAQALHRAADEQGWTLVTSTYGSMGEAICYLCDTGCSDSSNCFCDPKKYWSYNRAPAGSSSFRPSSVGASATQLSDGDVEGWRWGTGQAPPYSSVVDICGGPPPEVRTTSTTGSTSTAPPTTTTNTGPTTTGARSPTTTAAPVPKGGLSPTSSTAPPATTATSVAAPSTTSTSSPATGGRNLAARPLRSGRSTGPRLLDLMVYVALLAALGGLWIRARRARTRSS